MAEEIDAEAEQAVRDAFAGPVPHNSTTIPQRALEALDDREAGAERIYAAIEAMQGRGDLNAPADPWKDWGLAPES